MKLPELRYGSGNRKSTQVKFGGLNMGVGAADGEIVHMHNLTSDHYPVMAVREKRWRIASLSQPGGLYSHDGLCWVDGTGFFYKGQQVGQVTAGQKHFGSMGPYIVILPDKAYYNTRTGVFGALEAAWSGEKLTFGNGLYEGEKAAANAVRCEGVIWSDIFRVSDTVTISGCAAHPENNRNVTIRSMDGDTMYVSENAFTLDGEEGAADYDETGSLQIRRSVPDLKYICENENRLWGCSEKGIFASAWDDIFNWNTYERLDSDSWAVEPSSPGAFTGCVSYKGYPIFFKEDHIYKIYGSAPSDFSCMGSATMGLQEGCPESFAVADEVLFYLGRNGVCAYSGGIPSNVAQAFGTERYYVAAGGSDGMKYYVSMLSRAGRWSLFVYDTRLGEWYREDDARATHFASYDGGLYMLTSEGDIWLVSGLPPEGAEEEAEIEWEVEFADFTGREPNRKAFNRLQLRAELDEGARMQVWIQFDSDGCWQELGDPIRSGGKQSFLIPIVPRRCDHYALKLTGTGGCRVWSLAQQVRTGSDHH